MGWTDKISQAWHASGGAIGATWSFVNDKDPLQAIGLDGASDVASSVSHAALTPFKMAAEGAAGGLEDAGRIVGTPFKYAGRGISTGLQVAGQAHAQDKGQLLFSQDAWDQAWDRSKNVSPGQAFMTNAVSDLNQAPFDASAITQGFQPNQNDLFSDDQAQDRHDYFYSTPAGRFSSGSIDLWLNFAADPVGAVGGTIAKVSKERKALATAEDIGKTGGGLLDIAGKLGVKGPEAPDRTLVIDESLGYSNGNTNAERRAGRQLSDLYHKTDNLTAAEMNNLPQFRNTADSGILSYFFERANQMHPDDQDLRHGLKADIIGVALGNQESVQRITDFDTGLASELQRAGSTIPPSEALNKFTWDDGGRDMLNHFNLVDNGPAARNEDTINNLERERARLERLMNLDSGYNQTGSSLLEKAGTNFRNNKLNETIIPNGAFGRPIRAVLGTTSTRVPGFVHVKDTNRGYQDVQSLVSNMRYTPVATKKALLAQFAQSANDGERRNIVDTIENQMFSDAAVHYGMKPEAAKSMLSAVADRRGAYMESLSTKLYSAAEGDNLISHVDPEDDIEDVFSKPFLQTQIESAHAVTDPRVLHKALASGTNRRLLEAWTEARAAKAAGTKVHDITDSTMSYLDDFATMVTRPWKDLMLMRGAYPLRIQVDTQMRLMAHMGLLQYMLEAGHSFAGLGKYALSVKDDTINKQIKAVSGTIGRKEEVNGSEITPGRTNDEIARAWGAVSSHGGVMADLGNDVQSLVVKGYRGTGNFGRIDKNDKLWFGHWKRAVQQIQGSPTAKQALETPDVDDLKQWLSGNAAGRREFQNFAAGRSPEEWLGLVSAHANTYVPTNDLRRYVLRGMTDDTKDARKALKADLKPLRLDAMEKQSRRREALQRSRDKKVEVDQAYDEWKAARSAVATAKTMPGRGRKPLARTLDDGSTATMTDGEYKRYKVQQAQDRLDTAATSAKRLRLEHKDLKGKRIVAIQKSKIANAKARNVADRKLELENEHTQAVADNDISPNEITSWSHAQKYFESPIGQADKMDVHGESYSPINSAGGKILQQLGQKRNAFYRIFADMPETVLGRAPLYSFTYKRYMRDALGKIEGDVVDSERLERIRLGAHKAATKELSNVLFDTSSVSNLSHTMRHLSPFFSAWEDTMKKWGSMIVKDPTIGTTLAKAYYAPNNAGMVIDSEGNQIDKWGNLIDPETGKIMPRPKDYEGKGEYITIPASWVPNKIASGSFTINKSSANILFQGDPAWLPGTGPLVQVPTNYISKKMFPDKVSTDPFLKYVLPYGNQSLGDTVLPQWVKQARNALGDTQDHAATFTMLMAQEQTKFDNGDRKTKPTTAEIEKATRNWFILRSAIGFGSPVSMLPRPEYQLYIDKAHQYKAKYGQNWTEKYYEDFPQYFKMSVSLSTNESGVTASPRVYTALKDPKIREAISQDPSYGWFLLGPDNAGSFDQNVYQWMQDNDAAPGQKFYGKKTPEQAIADSDEQVGWVQYNKGMELLDEALHKRGLYSYQLKGAEDLAEIKKGFITSIADKNRSWFYAYSQRNDSKVQQLFDVAEKNWKANPKLAQRNDQQALKQYMQGRELFSQALNQRGVTSLDNPANQDLAQMWGQFIDGLKNKSPSFGVMYSRVLEGDQINKAVLSGEGVTASDASTVQ